MYTLVYGENIKIFLGDILQEEFPIGIFHTNEFKTKREAFKASGLKELLNFNETKLVFEGSVQTSIVPRDYQEEVVEKTCHPGTLNGIIHSPTRSGKTNMIGFTIARENKSSLILVHSVLLAKQIERALVKLFKLDSKDKEKYLGLIADDRKEIGRPILICTWQSLQDKKTLKAVRSYGYNLLFGDEAHRASADVLSWIVQSYKAQKKFGFSASPYRTNQTQTKKLHDTFGPVIHKVPIEHLYKNGYLIRPEFHRVSSDIHVSIEAGIRLYYQQKLSKNISYRRIIASNLMKSPQYKHLVIGKSIKELMFSPDDNDIQVMTTVAIASLNESLKESEDRESIRIGIAKKGIDFNIERLKTIEDHLVKVLKRDSEKAVIAFHLVGACMYMYDKLKEHGFNNILLINSKNKNDKELEKIMIGENNNYIILTTYQYFAEGIDIPTLENVVAASPYYPPFCRVETAEQLSGRCITPDPESPMKKPKIYYINDQAADAKTKIMKSRVDNILSESFQPVRIVEDSKKKEYFQKMDASHKQEKKMSPIGRK